MTLLPELKTGQTIRSPRGTIATVRRLSRRMAEKLTGHDEPAYRLIYRNALDTGHDVTSPRIWTLDDLAKADLTVIE